MERRQALFFTCLASAGLILVLNFYMSGDVILAMVPLLPTGTMVYAYRRTQHLAASFSLAGFSILSAAGVVLNHALIPMGLATCAALASWDFVLEGKPQLKTKHYEKLHLCYLGAAIGMGLLGTATGLLLHLRLPFVGMLGLVVAALISINQVMKYIQHDRASHR